MQSIAAHKISAVRRIESLNLGLNCMQKMNLIKGDHIFVKRTFHSHHGIYLGDGRVIHFKGTHKEKSNPVVTETGLDQFLNGGILQRRDYRKRLPREETVRRTRELLNQKDYSLISNNCEHLATWCVTGKASSRQVKRGAGAVIVAVITAAGIIGWKSRKKVKL